MTTNYIEKLDPALIRPGRCDFKIQLGYCDTDQIVRFFKKYKLDLTDGEIQQLESVTRDITPAEIQNVFKYYILKENAKEQILKTIVSGEFSFPIKEYDNENEE